MVNENYIWSLHWSMKPTSWVVVSWRTGSTLLVKSSA